jgi:hypothetical protein
MKRILCLLLLLSLAVGAHAQKKDKGEKKGLKIGLKAGFNRSSVAFKDGGGVDLQTTAKAAFNGGLYARWYLLKGRVVVQPELLYSREGFVYDSTVVASASAEDVRTRLSFMNVPLNITIRPSKHFNLQLGPSFGYLVSAIQKSDNIDKESILGIMNRPEFALNFGMGFDVLKIFSVNLRYKHGLTGLTSGDVAAVQTNPLEAVRLFNRLFQVSVGLNLFKKKDEFGYKASAQRYFSEKRTFFKQQY